MKVIRSVGHLSWVNEGSQLLVVDEVSGTLHLLHGAEAALWRWLHQSISWQEIQALFFALNNHTPEEGESRIAEILRKWNGDGLIEVCNG